MKMLLENTVIGGWWVALTAILPGLVLTRAMPVGDIIMLLTTYAGGSVLLFLVWNQLRREYDNTKTVPFQKDN